MPEVPVEDEVLAVVEAAGAEVVLAAVVVADDTVAAGTASVPEFTDETLSEDNTAAKAVLFCTVEAKNKTKTNANQIAFILFKYSIPPEKGRAPFKINSNFRNTDVEKTNFTGIKRSLTAD